MVFLEYGHAIVLATRGRDPRCSIYIYISGSVANYCTWKAHGNITIFFVWRCHEFGTLFTLFTLFVDLFSQTKTWSKRTPRHFPRRQVIGPVSSALVGHVASSQVGTRTGGIFPVELYRKALFFFLFGKNHGVFLVSCRFFSPIHHPCEEQRHGTSTSIMGTWVASKKATFQPALGIFPGWRCPSLLG